jgi:hypothetical protein
MTFTKTITGLLAFAAIGGLALVPATAEAKDGNKGKSKSSKGKGNNGKNPKTRGEHDNRRVWDSKNKCYVYRQDRRDNDRYRSRDRDDDRDWDDDRYRTRDRDDDRYRDTRDWNDDRYRDTRDWNDDYRSRSSIERESDRRQETKNEWRNIAYVSGAAALLGYINKDETLMFTGIAGALYSLHRYEQDRKSQNSVDRLRASYFGRSYFVRDGRRYDRRTVTKNGQKYYQFVRS